MTDSGKRMTRLILFTICCLMLCGCAAVRERIEQELWQRSGVTEDAEWKEFQQMDSASQLDKDGLFYSEALEQQRLEAAKEPEGSVRVTFARNDFLNVTYYRDEALTDALPDEGCLMNPGDAIYASEPVILNPNSLYHFSVFQILEFNEKGRISDLLASATSVPGEIYRIPETFEGTEISILPLGAYRNRMIHLNAVSLQNGEEQVLENGSWEINGKRYGNVSVPLNPMESYRVVYDYSPYKDAMYFSGSDPECYWDNSGTGTITFLSGPTDEAEVSYRVTLHPYGNLTVINGVSFQNPLDSLLGSASAIFGNKDIIEINNIIEMLQVNSLTVINNFSDTEAKVPNLKVGDTVFIRVPAELKLLSDSIPLGTPEEKDGDREYSFPVPDTENMDFRVTVSLRNSDHSAVFQSNGIQHGKLSVRDSSGIEYRDGSEAPAENEKVTVTIVPDPEFCVYGKNVRENVYSAEMKYSDYLKDLDSILKDHPIKPGIIVNLDTEDELGECSFWSGTQSLTGRVVLREDQDLQFDYILRPDAGYEVYMSPEDAGGLINVWNELAATRELPVTTDMDGKTLRCRDYINLRERTVINVPEVPF